MKVGALLFRSKGYVENSHEEDDCLDLSEKPTFCNLESPKKSIRSGYRHFNKSEDFPREETLF